jgi:hypothetical protein
MKTLTHPIPLLFVLGVLGPLGAAACGSTAAENGATARSAAAASAVEVPAGTVVAVRLTQALSTVRNRTGDPIEATLENPIAVDGREVLAKGTKFIGHVTTSESSGRMEGRGVLGITLDAFETNGRRYDIETSLDTRTTNAHKERNIELIGGGAGVGTLIGAVAGGGKGAAIGAAVGTAAGAGAAAATGKKDVEVPAETVFQFSLKSPVKLT